MSAVTRRGLREGTIAAFALALALGAGAQVGKAATLKAVTAQEEPTPVAGFLYQKLSSPAISDASGERVAFSAKTRRTPGYSGNVQGIFSEAPGGSGSSVALKYDPAPGGGTFNRFKDPTIDAAGTVAFAAKLSAGAHGAYLSGPSQVALLGDPDTGTGLLKEFSFVTAIFGSDVSATTDVAFKATINTPATIGGVPLDHAVYLCSGGDLNCSSGSGARSLLVTVQDAVDDQPGREICLIDKVGASSYGIAFTGESALDCADTLEIRLQGVFRQAFGGTIETVAQAGNAANPYPGLGGTVYAIFRGAPDMATDGTVAFRGQVAGLLSRDIFFKCDPATCPAAPAEAFVQVGDAVPGGNTISSLRAKKAVSLSDDGDIAFVANTKGIDGTSTGVFVKRAGGSIEVIALKDDPAPKVNPSDPSATFRQFEHHAEISPGGRVTFKAKVKRALGSKRTRDTIFVYE